jgi:hypothetical protein
MIDPYALIRSDPYASKVLIEREGVDIHLDGQTLIPAFVLVAAVNKLHAIPCHRYGNRCMTSTLNYL